ncbi:hypothetical protein BU23DRAFT_449989, partial [Bimuria novae-zelandiae CBS 107.79]
RKHSFYFNLLYKNISKYYIKAYYIYNMDKKSYMLTIISYLKRILDRASYKDKIRRSTI